MCVIARHFFSDGFLFVLETDGVRVCRGVSTRG